jgi:hypothetical protein
MKRNGAEEFPLCGDNHPPEVVTFDLQGTHKYTIVKSNLEKFPDTLLAKMVHYNGGKKKEEHFISQDGELFRYICMFYNLNILVDYKDAGVSESVWEAYVDYFGLTDVHKRPEKRLKVTVKPEYLEIVDQYKIDSLKERNNLVEIAIEMLTWMLREDELECDFLEFAPEDQGGIVPDEVLEELELYPTYRQYYLVKQEHLDVACDILGLASAKITYPDPTRRPRMCKYPANNFLPNRRKDGIFIHSRVEIKVI